MASNPLGVFGVRKGGTLVGGSKSQRAREMGRRRGGGRGRRAGGGGQGHGEGKEMGTERERGGGVGARNDGWMDG